MLTMLNSRARPHGRSVGGGCVPPNQYSVVANSTFLDAFGEMAVGSTDPSPAIQTLANNPANDVWTATQLLDPMLGYPGNPSSLQRANSGDLINVALMVERATPQSQLDALLGGDSADRASYYRGPGRRHRSTSAPTPRSTPTPNRPSSPPLTIRPQPR